MTNMKRIGTVFTGRDVIAGISGALTFGVVCYVGVKIYDKIVASKQNNDCDINDIIGDCDEPSMYGYFRVRNLGQAGWVLMNQLEFDSDTRVRVVVRRASNEES